MKEKFFEEMKKIENEPNFLSVSERTDNSVTFFDDFAGRSFQYVYLKDLTEKINREDTFAYRIITKQKNEKLYESFRIEYAYQNICRIGILCTVNLVASTFKKEVYYLSDNRYPFRLEIPEIDKETATIESLKDELFHYVESLKEYRLFFLTGAIKKV